MRWFPIHVLYRFGMASIQQLGNSSSLNREIKCECFSVLYAASSLWITTIIAIIINIIIFIMCMSCIQEMETQSYSVNDDDEPQPVTQEIIFPNELQVNLFFYRCRILDKRLQNQIESNHRGKYKRLGQAMRYAWHKQ